MFFVGENPNAESRHEKAASWAAKVEQRVWSLLCAWHQVKMKSIAPNTDAALPCRSVSQSAWLLGFEFLNPGAHDSLNLNLLIRR